MTDSISTNYCYNKTERDKYRDKRKSNIESFVCMIQDAKRKNQNLLYDKEVNRMVLYKTSQNEKICIQFPGKESSQTPNTKPFDFKPLILRDDGHEIKDMLFSDMFNILSQIKDDELLKQLALIIFRISRLTLHDFVDKDSYQETNNLDNIHIFEHSSAASNTALSLNWHKLKLKYEEKCIDNATQKALQQIISFPRSLNIFDDKEEPIKNQSFSLEAFLYFIDLLMLNEDIKYNYKQKNAKTKKHKKIEYYTKLSQSGRKGTSDIMLGVIFFLLKKITLPIFLQKLVKARGVIRLENDFYKKIPGLTIDL